MLPMSQRTKDTVSRIINELDRMKVLPSEQGKAAREYWSKAPVKRFSKITISDNKQTDHDINKSHSN